MTDQTEGSTALAARSTTDRIVPSCVVGLLGTLLIVSGSVEPGQAASTIGLVLAEAFVLYVGYGAVTRAASPAVRGLLVSD